MFEQKNPTSFIIAREQMAQAERTEQPSSRRTKERRDLASQVVEEDSISLDFKKKTFILDMAFNEKYQILGLVATDGRIFFYQSKEKELKLR